MYVIVKLLSCVCCFVPVEKLCVMFCPSSKAVCDGLPRLAKICRMFCPGWKSSRVVAKLCVMFCLGWQSCV